MISLLLVSIPQGKPYSSKPHVVVFRNFDVGKLYSKKVKLTNISYTVNRLQLEGVSTSLADFVTVSFEPPGPMSAGMSCSMQVSFSPQVRILEPPAPCTLFPLSPFFYS